MSFPSNTPSYAGFTGSHTLSADNHDSQHNSEQADIIGLANKVGTGASLPTSGVLLRGNGPGTSAWDTVHLSSDVQGILSTANGGTGTTAATGSGPVVYGTAPAITNPTFTSGAWGGSPTLTTPIIADFTNANHNHQNTGGGGVLDDRAVLLRNNQSLQAKNSSGASTNILELASDNTLRLSQLPYQNVTTNNTQTNVLMQTGWRWVSSGAGGTSVLTLVMSYPQVFTALLGLTVTVIGMLAGSDPVNLTDLNSSTNGDVVGSASVPTTSGFTANIKLISGTFAASQRWGIAWQAWGT